MIEINTHKERIGHVEYFSLSLYGHAESGEDASLVCSSVSTLCCSLMDMAAQLDDFDTDEMYESGEGELRYCYPAENIRCKTVIDFVLNGLNLIAENYPENVHIKNSVEVGVEINN
jgi:uncharacterized protein YsxB (DUF464 family)